MLVLIVSESTATKGRKQAAAYIFTLQTMMIVDTLNPSSWFPLQGRGERWGMAVEAEAARKGLPIPTLTQEFGPSCHKYVLSTNYIPGSRVSIKYTAVSKRNSVPQRASILKRKIPIT